MSKIPVVGIDYFFITAGGVKKRDELEYSNNPEGHKELEAARAKGEVVKCMVVRCNLNKVLFGQVVPCKGPDENGDVAGTVLDDIKWLGHTKLVIEADTTGTTTPRFSWISWISSDFY